MSEQIWGNPSDKIAYSSNKPDIQYLSDELNRSLYYGGNMSRLTTSDDQRMCRWEGQSDDGKKHEEYLGYEPFPFEGSSDVRNRLIDNTINQLVMLVMTAWQRASIRVNGIEMNDAEKSGAAQTLMHWIVNNRMRAELEREAELWAQYAYQFGWSAMHVGWDRRVARKTDMISMADIGQAAQQGNTMLQQVFESLQTKTVSDLSVLLISQSLLCDEKEAKRIVKDIIENGSATYEQPYIQRNLPVVAALKPFDEIAFPPETVELQEARMIFKRTFMTEVQLKSIGLSEGWDEDFIEEAITTAGKSGYLHDSNLIPLINSVPNAVEKANNLIEVVYCYARQLDESNKSAIYYTVFCPQTQNDLFGKHEILDYAHGEYPFVELRRERLRRPVVESRGVPEILFTDQEELKAQHDATRDRTAFEVMPPMTVTRRLANNQRIGPGQLLPVNNKDDYAWLPPPSGTPVTAFNLMDRIEQKVAITFGLYHPNVMPALTQITQQYIVNTFFSAWSQVYKQMFALSMQYMLPEEIERITGVKMDYNHIEVNNMFDFSIRFDVKELDTNFVIEKLKAINQFVLPMDTAGNIDRSKLIKATVDAISPESARDIYIDQKTATQKQYAEVQNDLVKMMLGLEAQYVQNDPQAGVKMQAMQDILSKNPKAQQMAQTDGVFQALLQNYQKNLEMSIMQQQNAQIGRTGVSPVGDELKQKMESGEPIEPQQ